MALTQCPNCGKNMSDRAEQCPHCGATPPKHVAQCAECGTPVSKSDAICPSCGHPTPWSRECPECGQFSTVDTEICPECGFDLFGHFGRVNTVANTSWHNQKRRNGISSETVYTEDNTIRHNNRMSWIVGVCLAVIAVGVAAFLYKGDNDVVKSEPVQSRKPSVEAQLRTATSVDEVEKLINGTTWHSTPNLTTSNMEGWVQVKFSQGTFSCYTANPSDGKWTYAGSGRYDIGEGRFANTGEKYVYISWKADYKVSPSMKLPCTYTFIPLNRQINVACDMLYHAMRGLSGDYYGDAGNNGNVGMMVLGEYHW